MTAADVLRRIVVALEQAQVPYMITGSFASAYYGAPRSSQDIDLVIAPRVDQIPEFLRLLPPAEYYADPEAATDASGAVRSST